MRVSYLTVSVSQESGHGSAESLSRVSPGCDQGILTYISILGAEVFSHAYLTGFTFSHVGKFQIRFLVLLECWAPASCLLLDGGYFQDLGGLTAPSC